MGSLEGYCSICGVRNERSKLDYYHIYVNKNMIFVM